MKENELAKTKKTNQKSSTKDRQQQQALGTDVVVAELVELEGTYYEEERHETNTAVWNFLCYIYKRKNTLDCSNYGLY